MVVLISQINTNGHRRSCDARCYGAKHDHCVCVCSGLNHGKGLQEAAQQTSDMAEKLLKQNLIVQTVMGGIK